MRKSLATLTLLGAVSFGTTAESPQLQQTPSLENCIVTTVDATHEHQPPVENLAQTPVYKKQTRTEVPSTVADFTDITLATLNERTDPYALRHTIAAMQSMIDYFEATPQEVTRADTFVTFGNPSVEEGMYGWLHNDSREHTLGLKVIQETPDARDPYQTFIAKLHLFDPTRGEEGRLPRHSFTNTTRLDSLTGGSFGFPEQRGILLGNVFDGRTWRAFSHAIASEYFEQPDWKPEDYDCCSNAIRGFFIGRVEDADGLIGEKRFIRALASGERDFSNCALLNLDLRPYEAEFNAAYDGKEPLNFHGAHLDGTIFPSCELPNIDLRHAFTKGTVFTFVNMPGALIDEGKKLIGYKPNR